MAPAKKTARSNAPAKKASRSKKASNAPVEKTSRSNAPVEKASRSKKESNAPTKKRSRSKAPAKEASSKEISTKQVLVQKIPNTTPDEKKCRWIFKDLYQEEYDKLKQYGLKDVYDSIFDIISRSIQDPAIIEYDAWLAPVDVKVTFSSNNGIQISFKAGGLDFYQIQITNSGEINVYNEKHTFYPTRPDNPTLFPLWYMNSYRACENMAEKIIHLIDAINAKNEAIAVEEAKTVPRNRFVVEDDEEDENEDGDY